MSTGRAQSWPGMHWVIVPSEVVRIGRRHPLLRSLLPTAAGYFPHCEGHFVRRPQGVPEVIIILCWSGRGWFEMAGRRRRVEAGETLFIPAHAPHAYGAEDDDPWSIVWAHAVGSEVATFLRELEINRSHAKLRLASDGLDQIGFHRVYGVLEDGYSPAHLIASASALRVVLAEMLRSQRTPRAPRVLTRDPAERALAWMRQNLGGRTSLRELARHAGASVSHLSGLFRKKVGYPPMDYFARLKIQHACRLLDTTQARIKSIGAEVGFQDPYYFSRLFQHVMGMSPRQYRAVPKG